MITKNDCMSLLVQLEDRGVKIDAPMRKLAISREVPMDVLKFIAENKGIEVINFYEMLRKRHNQKKSPLYTNILRDEQTDINEGITTLSCLLTQVILYGKKLEDNSLFFKEVRAEEISRVMHDYFETNDFSGCQKMLQAIKTDLLVLEYINGRRELAA